jgi:ketosteroid isomerase-like protein
LRRNALLNPEAGEKVSARRRATYVFRRDAGVRWVCTVDNAYGTDILDQRAGE